MIRTQISLDERQMERAKAAAAARGVSLAGLIRLALGRLLDSETDAAARRQALDAVGGFRSGESDVSERHDEVPAGPVEG